MPKSQTDSSFERSVNKWSLIFNDEKEEVEYQSNMGKSLRLPYLAIGWIYFGLSLHVIYRVVAILSSFMKTGFPSAPPYIEATLLACVITSMVLETALRRFHLFEKVQGLFLYTTLPVVLVTAAFYTQRTPYFGIAYDIVVKQHYRSCFALVCTQSLTSVFVRYWFLAVIGNSIFAIQCITLYVSLFFHTTSTCKIPFLYQ